MSRYAVYLFAVFSLILGAIPPAHSAPEFVARVAVLSEEQEVESLMNSWIEAVARKKGSELAPLLDSRSKAHYLRIKSLALTGEVKELASLSETDQLQVMFFRLMIDKEQLRSMKAPQLLAFAVEKGFIGMELRRGDALREVRVTGGTAVGRLYKFGLADRPDPYQQYFVKERGSWRVSLQGEQERLRGEFDQFVERSSLSRSEAAFFILEMRLMRKVTPEDFFLTSIQADAETTDRSTVATSRPQDVGERFRLVAVRLPESLVGRPAVTLDDLNTGLKYVLHKGDALPNYPNLTLDRIVQDEAVFSSTADPSSRLVLPLDLHDRLSRRSVVSSASDDTGTTLLDEAILGDNYQGQMMMQWRNIGLRGRAQLLQQSWLTPEYGGAEGPDKLMLALKVRQVTPASFWDQIGLKEGDLLLKVNGMPIDTLNAWQKVIQMAQVEQQLTVTLLRDELELVFRTRTVKPV